MNPDQPSRDQIETRLTALLLGELPADEAALLRYTMAQDPALQQLHDELQATLVLVREAAKNPVDAAVEKNAPLKLSLSQERRRQLLAHFKTPRPKTSPTPLFWLKRIEVPWLVPTMVAVALVALLATLLLPSLATAKRKSLGRAQYGTLGLDARDKMVESLSELAAKSSRPMLANHAAEPAPSASAPPPPSVAPVQVTLAPETQLAPPPVAPPPVQIALPQPESAPEIVAQASAPAEAGKSPVYSQEIVGYVNIPEAKYHDATPITTSESSLSATPLPAPRGIAAPPVESDSSQLAYYKPKRQETVDKLDRQEHIENNWTVPAQAMETYASGVATGTGGGGGGGSPGAQNAGAVSGMVNAFAGGGDFRGNGQGALSGFGDRGTYGGGVFSGGADGVNNGTLTPQPGSSAPSGEATSLPAAKSFLPRAQVRGFYDDASGLAQRASEQKQFQRSGNYEGFFGPGQQGVENTQEAPAASPLAWSRSPNQSSAAQLPTGGSTRGYRVPTDVAAAGNRFDLKPAEESDQKKVPALGDLPVVGNLFQSSAESSKEAPVATPAPLSPAAPAATTALGFNFAAGAPTASGGTPDSSASGRDQDVTVFKMTNSKPEEVAQVLQSMFPSGKGSSQYGNSSQNSALQQRSANATTTMGTTATFDTAPAPNADAFKLGLPNDSLKTDRAKEEPPLPAITTGGAVQFAEAKKLVDAERAREVQQHQANVQYNGLYLPPTESDGAPAWIGTLDKLEPKQPSDAAVPEGNNHFISRYASTVPVGQLQDPKAVSMNDGGNKTFVLAKTAKDESFETAQRDLQQKLKMHQMLNVKLVAMRVDESLDTPRPLTSMVQITDPAQPGRSQNFWQRLTGQVESTARVKVENDVNDIAGLGNTPTATSFDPYFIQTTFEIMQSEPVLGKVVDALNLQSVWASKNGGEKLTKAEAMAQLKQRLEFQPVRNTKLIEIGAKSDDPNEAAAIANGVARAYAEYRAESRRDLTTNGIAVLENQFKQQAKEIQLAQAEVDRLGKEPAPKPNQTTPAPESSDRPVRKPAPNAPVPQPEILTRDNNFSTFSLNVSDVSFKFAEASLQNGKLPDTASIRSEEFINAFDYRDPEAAAGQPLSFTSERARYPFAHNRELLRFAVKTAAAGRQAGRALNLVLLLDISGSMERADRVAIIRESLRVLATQLQPQDTVSVVTFSRTARLWADGVSGDKAGATLDQVGGITPEGGTNLEEAMRLAYETAHRHYLPSGMNRVVLLTDGAANLGNVDPDALRQKVEAQRKQGIALDCFGIGWEDYNDDLLEQLSSHGDGRYAFLNSPEDSSKDFATKLAGALQIAAADVKVQVEFNPARVVSYRQIGYAKHQLTKEQFRDNTVAAGEIAAQEAGNALYTIEINPNGDGPIATVHVRYRIPGTTDYREHSWDVAYTGSAPALDQSSPAMRLAATASAFSEWLAASPYAQEVAPDDLLKFLRGVPEIYGADDRPKQLETMIREAKSLEGKWSGNF